MGIIIDQIFISAAHRPEEQFNPYIDNTDVIVHLSDGKKYTASFFAYKNIELEAITNKAKKDFLNGRYLWVQNMVLIESCTTELIKEVVQEMIDEGEFSKAFCQL